ncbi:hypothetical protein Leryth_023056 [Lithospermum erythrorhizon]|nr:hypothetical protein Leryth_023056 [Lithospermum erythrorhizon]
MVYYLINSCGFTPEKAVSASKYVNFSKPEKPNAVISFFKNQGFSDSDNLVGSNNELISIVKCCPALLMYRHVVAPNSPGLQKILHRADRYKELVDEVKEMGIHPQKFVFMLAVMVRSGLSKSSWEKKMELYEKWGCSEKVVMTAFKNYPYCMAASLGKIEAVFEYLVNEMGWEAPILMKTPLVLKVPERKFLVDYVSCHEKKDQELLKLYNEKLKQES